VKGFFTSAFRARNVPIMSEHVGSIVAFSRTGPVRPEQEGQRTLTRVPRFVALSLPETD
jgi:hypothetical protein